MSCTEDGMHNQMRKGLDGVSEAHEALPDPKICGDARLIGNVGGNGLYARLAD